MNTRIVKRVYHLLPEEWALCDIKHRRLKVATFDDVNDPFELLGIDLRNQNTRSEVKRWRKHMKAQYGMLCFSAGWENPLLWSHYADRHKGICLGFDVPAKYLHKVEYREKRLLYNQSSLKYEVGPILWTKFLHWKYEAELRRIVSLDKCCCDYIDGKRCYFWPFGKDLKLRVVVGGACCDFDKVKFEEALGGLMSSITLIKAREAFRSFDVVVQRRGFKFENLSS